MVLASSSDSTIMTAAATPKTFRIASRSAVDHLVDVVALRRQHQRAAHGAEALHRHRDRDDHFAALVDAHHAALLAARATCATSWIALAVLRAEFAIERQVAAVEPGADRDPSSASTMPGLSVDGGGRFEAQHVAAAIEVAAVEDQPAVAVVDARARLGRRDQAAQHRRDAFRIDREIQPEYSSRHAVAFAGLQIEQAVGIDGDGVGLRRWPRRRSRRR